MGITEHDFVLNISFQQFKSHQDDCKTVMKGNKVPYSYDLNFASNFAFCITKNLMNCNWEGKPLSHIDISIKVWIF